MKVEPINERESEAIRRRLVVIRTHVSGSNQAAFARTLGISPTRWNNIERGFPLTLNLLFLLTKTVPGLTPEYVTHGSLERMQSILKRQLSTLEDELFPSPKSRASSQK
jgi:hypothetical protein